MNTCEKFARKFSGMNTSKSRVFNPFAMNTYKKGGGRGGLLPTAAALVFLLTLSAVFASAQIPTLNPEDHVLDQAKSVLDQGNAASAEHIVRQYIADHPESAEAHFLLGLILFREVQLGASAQEVAPGQQFNALNSQLAQQTKEKAEASLAEYTAGARFHKPSAADLKVVALDYVLLADFADADKWLSLSLQWDPSDPQAWYLLGRAKYNENRFEEAIQSFQQCLRFEPRNAKAEDNLGLSYEGLGKFAEAIAAYRRAIALESSGTTSAASAGPYLDLGSLLLDQSRPQDAVQYLLRATEIAPGESRAHEKLGKAYELLNRLPEAQSELQKAVQLSPESARLHFMLGQVYRKQGLTQKAKDELDRSAALNGTHSVP